MKLKFYFRAERLSDPAYYVEELIKRAKKEDLKRIYKLDSYWEDGDGEDFLRKVAEKKGKLRKVILFENICLF